MSKDSFFDLLKKAINPKPSVGAPRKSEPQNSESYTEKQTRQDNSANASQKQSGESL